MSNYRSLNSYHTSLGVPVAVPTHNSFTVPVFKGVSYTQPNYDSLIKSGPTFAQVYGSEEAPQSSYVSYKDSVCK